MGVRRCDSRFRPDATDHRVTEPMRDGDRVVNRHRASAQAPRVRSGALESSNVDAIGETLAILTAQRSFETAQKTFDRDRSNA